MYKFIKTRDKNNEYDLSDVIYTVNTDDIDRWQLQEEFDNFLRACGFVITKEEGE